ncbi:Tomoregulin-2 [Liparis tanakae]|uniref:Tomoregulin-2 n=1 Tax=Liparis tanakae TaxID=230148 RepID=A0A4Z2IN56_9TELE|nr:Tomoregulin-2 [Liparis tanakae]
MLRVDWPPSSARRTLLWFNVACESPVGPLPNGCSTRRSRKQSCPGVYAASASSLSHPLRSGLNLQREPKRPGIQKHGEGHGDTHFFSVTQSCVGSPAVSSRVLGNDSEALLQIILTLLIHPHNSSCALPRFTARRFNQHQRQLYRPSRLIEEVSCVCVCNIDCSHISFNPVCASDGRSYDNPCQVKEASCQKQERIEVKYLGHCQGDIKGEDGHFARTDLTVDEKTDPRNELARGLSIPCPDHYKNYCVHGECQFPSILAPPSCRREFTRSTVRRVQAMSVETLREGRGLSLCLVSVKTVIISFIHQNN